MYKRDFWSQENLKYTQPHYRMRKVARVVNRFAGGKACRLLDIGCGPATLRSLLDPNIAYYGIDIAIPQPSPGLVERDLLQEPIGSDHAPFDLIVAQGFFEYMADAQSQKFAEIADLLAPDGRFVVTYVNFDHRRPAHYTPYSNIQAPGEFQRSLTRHFAVEESRFRRRTTGTTASLENFGSCRSPTCTSRCRFAEAQSSARCRVYLRLSTATQLKLGSLPR